MHKKAIIILSLLLILFTSVPIVVGFIFRSKLNTTIKQVNIDPRVKIEIVDYRQGIFQSNVIFKFTFASNLTKPINDEKAYSFFLAGKVYHGPLFYNENLNRLQWGYALVFSRLFLLQEQDKYININVLAGFDGKWKGRIIIPQWQVDVNNVLQLLISGLDAKFIAQIDEGGLRRLKYNATVKQLEAYNKSLPASVIMRSIKAKYDASQEQGLWSGTSVIYMPKFYYQDEKQNIINAERFAITSTFSMNLSIIYIINLAISINKITSPSFSIPAFSNLKIISTAENFNALGWHEFINFFRSKNAATNPQLVLQTAEALLMQIIAANSTIKSYITSDTSLGSFVARTDTNWPQNQPLPKTLEQALNNAYTVITLNLSDELLIKILNVYGEQLTAPSGAIINQEKSKELADTYLKDQQPSLDNNYRQLVQDLLKQNKISIPISLQLNNFFDQHQTLNAFMININQLELPNDIKARLITAYQAESNQMTLIVNAKAQQLIKDLITINYIKKEDKGYLTEIIVEKGVFKINGSPIFAPINQKSI